MKDEAKTWWLVSGPNVASSHFFLKKIRVALESRTLISVPLLQAMTLKEMYGETLDFIVSISNGNTRGRVLTAGSLKCLHTLFGKYL